MISFIVPAYNEEPLLGGTLAAIHEAAGELDEAYEIVVADDASTDATAAIATDHGARIVSVNHRQIAATRNAGARSSEGELLIFVDADTVVAPAVVCSAVAAMRSGAAGGGCAFWFGGRLPYYARLLQAVIVPAYRILGLASGCFLYCTRAAFEAVGGFDETLFGAEEYAMSRALHRQGRFVVLRQSVTTSGRKLRTYSACELLGLMIRIALTGRRSLRRRSDRWAIWYGERRADPDETPSGSV